MSIPSKLLGRSDCMLRHLFVQSPLHKKNNITSINEKKSQECFCSTKNQARRVSARSPEKSAWSSNVRMRALVTRLCSNSVQSEKENYDINNLEKAARSLTEAWEIGLPYQ